MIFTTGRSSRWSLYSRLHCYRINTQHRCQTCHQTWLSDVSRDMSVRRVTRHDWTDRQSWLWPPCLVGSVLVTQPIRMWRSTTVLHAPVNETVKVHLDTSSMSLAWYDVSTCPCLPLDNLVDIWPETATFPMSMCFRRRVTTHHTDVVSGCPCIVSCLVATLTSFSGYCSVTCRLYPVWTTFLPLFLGAVTRPSRTTFAIDVSQPPANLSVVRHAEHVTSLTLY